MFISPSYIAMYHNLCGWNPDKKTCKEDIDGVCGSSDNCREGRVCSYEPRYQQGDGVTNNVWGTCVDREN